MARKPPVFLVNLDVYNDEQRVLIHYGGVQWKESEFRYTSFYSRIWSDLWTLDGTKSMRNVKNGDITDLIGQIREAFPEAPNMSIVVKLTGDVLWSENHKQGDETMPYADEVPAGAGFLEQPLTIPRTKLIEVLQAKLDKEQADREAIVAARAAKRIELHDAIMGLSDDELINMIMKLFGFSADSAGALKKLNEAVEAKTYVSPEVQPNSTESKLDQLVRAFTLANNDVIEVKPTDSLYQLL